MVTVKEIFSEWAKQFNENEDYLTKLDSVAGDADLGFVMKDGFSKTAKFLENETETDVGKLFFNAGKYFNSVASSSMGTLLSTGFKNVGKELKGKTELADGDIYIILKDIAEGIQNLGKAKEGDKTILDSLFPAVRALEHASDIKVGIEKAVEAAEQGVENAKNMVAKTGRIAFRGEDSKGIVDPGSVVALILVKGLKNIIVD